MREDRARFTVTLATQATRDGADMRKDTSQRGRVVGTKSQQVHMLDRYVETTRHLKRISTHDGMYCCNVSSCYIF